MPRCDDCLDEFPPDAERFAVLKHRTVDDEDVERADIRTVGIEQADVASDRLAWALMHEPAFVCGDCAGWYGDDAIAVTAAEAGHA